MKNVELHIQKVLEDRDGNAPKVTKINGEEVLLVIEHSMLYRKSSNGSRHFSIGNSIDKILPEGIDFEDIISNLDGSSFNKGA